MLVPEPDQPEPEQGEPVKAGYGRVEDHVKRALEV
jgi:hypothetical protein